MIKKTFLLLFFTAGAVASIFLILCIWIMTRLPSDKELRGCFVTQMYEVQLCPGSARYTKFSEISPYLIDAVILSEDAKFYSHHGFDLEELKNSLEKNLSKGFYARGGSTITQQLAKNLYLTKDKTLLRKVNEALITIQIEKYLKKKEILEKYLNVVQFAQGTFGVKAAAEFYFQKSPAQLSLLESVFLAFLLPNPEKYSQSYKKKELTPFARKRLIEIIDRMAKVGKITPSEHSEAKSLIASMFKPIPEIQDLPSEQEEQEYEQFDTSAQAEPANGDEKREPSATDFSPESESAP